MSIYVEAALHFLVTWKTVCWYVGSGRLVVDESSEARWAHRRKRLALAGTQGILHNKYFGGSGEFIDFCTARSGRRAHHK